MAQAWEIVGGADKGGLIVREGQEVTSAKLPERLSTGARVEELELVAGRLHYRRLTGAGPQEGWISVSVQGRELARRAATAGAGGSGAAGGAVAGPSGAPHFDPYGALGLAPDATDAQVKSAFRRASLRAHPDHNPDPEAAAQFRRLVEAKDFLLNPLKRLVYNMAHGHQARRHYVQWWSTWDEIFEEIEPPEDEGPHEAPVAEPAAPLPSADARTDVLVFGASGFLGTLLCSMLGRELAGRTWAIAGRDERKLKLLEAKFGTGPHYRGKFRVEAAEDVALAVRTARVVLDVSGPKFLMGSFVARACIDAGTHYIDSTGFPGDTLASKQAFDDLDAEAKAAGVSLLYFCGLGAVLMDTGSWALVQHLRATHGLPTRRIDAYEISHGTMITGTTLQVAKGPENYEAELKRQGYFFLGGVPQGGLQKEDDESNAKPVQDPYAGMWAALSEIPEMIVVRCSYGLSQNTRPYGENFRFRVWLLYPDQAAASMNSLRMSNRFLRRGYEKHVELGKIPGPGQGPCERLRKEAVCTRLLVAEADESGSGGGGARAHCIVSPGPGGLSDHQEGTALVLLAAAGCALDALAAGGPGALVPGFGTPVHHLARLGLQERLAAKGYCFRLEPGAPPRELFQNALSAAGALAA